MRFSLSRLVLNLETLEAPPSLFPCNSQGDSMQGAFFFCEQRKEGGGKKEKEGPGKELQKMEKTNVLKGRDDGRRKKVKEE